MSRSGLYAVVAAIVAVIIIGSTYALEFPPPISTPRSSTSSSFAPLTTTTTSSASSSVATSSLTSRASLSIVVTPDPILMTPGTSEAYASVTLTSTGTSPGSRHSIGVSGAPGLSVNLTRQDIPLPAGEEQYSLIVTAGATQALGAYDLTVNATVGDSTKSQPFSVKLISDLVIMKNTLYDPANLTVRVGTTVVWLNLEGQICMCDPGTHDVVFSGGIGRSGPMAQFDAYSYTFTQVGTFRYYCSYHPAMTGLVVVSGM